jgi:putative ABC transport system substrate-binding protein
MRRREFVACLGGMAAAPLISWPRAARAQQSALPVLGYLGGGTPQVDALRLGAVREALKEAGFVEGQNLAIEFRWAEGQNDRLPALATDLVRRQVTMIAAAGGMPAALAAKAATTTIPIVFQTATDPIAAGLVASLARPGGNVTGVVSLNAEIGPKRLELLYELIPTATSFALLVNPANPITADALTRSLQEAARTLGLALHVLEASNERDFQTAFATVRDRRAGGLVIMPDPFFTSRSEQLAALALRHAVPAIFQFREFATAGGLISYGGSLTEAYRLIGTYAGRILKGEKPADLPVQQYTKIVLTINLKTAKALGLTIPETLLATADEVIE